MARVKRLKPRRKWTNRLAYVVWRNRKNNKERASLSGGESLTFNGSPLSFNGQQLTYEE